MSIIVTTPAELQALIKSCIDQAISDGLSSKKENCNEIYTLSETSEYLSLAKQTLYGLTSKREIPFIKKGKKLYFSKRELDLWLQEGKQCTKQEILNTIPGSKIKGGKP